MQYNIVNGEYKVCGCRLHEDSKDCYGRLHYRVSVFNACQYGCEKGFLEAFEGDRDRLDEMWPLIQNIRKG